MSLVTFPDGVSPELDATPAISLNPEPNDELIGSVNSKLVVRLFVVTATVALPVT